MAAASLLSGLTIYNRFFASAHLVEYDVGGGLPNKRLRFVVPGCQPLIDGPLKFFHAVEGSPADHPFRDEAKKAFDLVQPGTARRSEVKMEAPSLARLQPSLNSRALMSRVVVHDEVYVLIRWHLSFQMVEKLDELFGAMAGQTTTDHSSIENVERGE